MMTEAEALGILNRVGAFVRNDHVVYTSGLHGTVYVDKYKIYPHTAETSMLCSEIARSFVDDDVEAVVAPGEGGKHVSRWVAFHLSKLKSINERTLAFHADKVGGGHFVFTRGGATKFLPGKRVLVVDDVLHTGESVKHVIEATRELKAYVVGLAVIFNRGGITHRDVAYPPKMFSLVKLKLPSWTREECERIGPCSQGVPVNPNVGHGGAFIASHHRGERVS